mgnify:CR=1 FL=1
MLGKIKKKILGKNFYKLRSKYLLEKIFGDLYIQTKRKFKFFKKSLFFKNHNLNKTIEGQKLVKNEKGFLIDLTIDNYLSYHLRPKLSDDFKLESTCEIQEKFAIIIQGPIQENFNFLKNSLEIYKKIFKKAYIIISTWENEDPKIINKLKNSNTHIIFNKEIEKSKYNINQQIISTNAALNYARENNIKYCLKTRADIRICNNNLEAFLISLLKTFAVKKNNLINSRIIVPSLNTYKFRLYSLADIVMFGETNDLIHYFDSEDYNSGLKKLGLSETNWLINDTPLIPEVFLCSRLINKIEGHITWDLDNWWRCLRDYFCIIDNSSLDLFWIKYSWEIEYRYSRTYSKKSSRTVEFKDWISLYNYSAHNWHLFSNEHERYKEFRNKLKGTNIFID